MAGVISIWATAVSLLKHFRAQSLCGIFQRRSAGFGVNPKVAGGIFPGVFVVWLTGKPGKFRRSVLSISAPAFAGTFALHRYATPAAWTRLSAADSAVADAEAGRVCALLMYGQWRALEIAR